MILPSPKIVVIDDDPDDIKAIVDGLASLGTTALGIHYSPHTVGFPPLPCLRVLFLDLHLMEGIASTEQQIKSTIGVLTSLLTSDNGPYVLILWSSHANSFERFRDETLQRLPALGLPLPLQLVALDKIEFITTSGGRRLVSNPELLKESIIGRINESPQLSALLSWEEDVSRSVDDAIRQVIQIARATSSRKTPSDLAHGVNATLGELAAAAIGLQNAKDDAFRGINEVLVQVVSDRLQHRSASPETSDLWKRAVTEFRDKPQLNEHDSSLLNTFLHVETGDLLTRIQPGERGSVVNLKQLTSEQFVSLWGISEINLLNEFCLPQDYMRSNDAPKVEWVMAQIQPSCDHAQGNPCLLPYILGLRIAGISQSKLDKIKQRKYLWKSPILKDDEGIYHLVFHLRFIAGLHQAAEQLQVPVRYRLREQIMSDLTHALHSYGGRPGIISFHG